MQAGGGLTLQGAELSSEEDTRLFAEGDVVIASVQWS